MEILDDFWVNNQRWIVIVNFDTKGYEIYLSKVESTTRIDLVDKK